jgi:hypothetical protein
MVLSLCIVGNYDQAVVTKAVKAVHVYIERSGDDGLTSYRSRRHETLVFPSKRKRNIMINSLDNGTSVLPDSKTKPAPLERAIFLVSQNRQVAVYLSRHSRS